MEEKGRHPGNETYDLNLMTQKQTIRRLSLLFIAGLVLQSVVILGFGEPWPSIALPRFSDPGGMGKTFTTEIPELNVYFVDSTATRLSHHRFLGNLPRSFHSAIMEKNFRQAGSQAETSG